jgi:hypothetical protein
MSKIDPRVDSFVQDVLSRIHAYKWEPTGSRAYTFGDVNEHTDHDYIVLVSAVHSGLALQLIGEGFYDCSPADPFTAEGPYELDSKEWYICRHQETNANLIITENPQQYEVWLRCQEFTNTLQLTKPQRQYLFELMLNREARESTIAKLREAITNNDQVFIGY